jgi:hypothetical protein
LLGKKTSIVIAFETHFCMLSISKNPTFAMLKFVEHLAGHSILAALAKHGVSP